MTVQVTQRVEDLSPEVTRKFIQSVRSAFYTQPGKNAAFREWVLKSRLGDKLPRGSYFKGQGRPVTFVMDEAWHVGTR